MNAHSEDEQRLDSMFESWSAPDCGPEFSAKVVRQALGEGPVAFPLRRRRVLVPLLLVACLFSAGAWAGWAQVQESRNSVPLAATSDSPTSKPSRAKFQFTTGVADAEPERATGVSAEPKRSRASAVSPKNKGVAAPAPVPAHKVHLPRCECGIGAIVCTCSD